jgi:unsaturated rhamnogalacturonyl hydrolase
MWLDGLYMVSPFYAHYTATYESGNVTGFDDVVKQFTLTHENCANNNASQKGLLKHGYDSSRTASWADTATGASPEVVSITEFPTSSDLLCFVCQCFLPKRPS